MEIEAITKSRIRFSDEKNRFFHTKGAASAHHNHTNFYSIPFGGEKPVLKIPARKNTAVAGEVNVKSSCVFLKKAPNKKPATLLLQGGT